MKIHDFEATTQKLKPFLSEYLEDQGIDPSKKFTCPFPNHNDSTPSCNVVGESTDSPRFYCHGCGQSGDIFDAVQIYEKKPALGTEWVEDTLKYLATKYGVEVQTKDLTEEEIYEIDTFKAYRAAARLISATKLDDTRHGEFIAHIRARGWTPEILQNIGVGTVNSFEEFYSNLRDLGFTDTFLKEIDLKRKDIFHEKNMIFTWKDERGRPIGFTSRNLLFEQQKEEAKKNNTKIKTPKYNNQRTTGLKCNIFQKGSRFYGIDTAVKECPPLYIFEGQTDVISARAVGLPNCVAIGGSNLHGDHVLLLKELGIFDIVLCLDGDETGRKKTAEILEEKLSGHRDMQVKVVMLPDNDDPDTFFRREGLQAFKNLAHWSAFEWRLNRFDEDDDTTHICKQMIPFIVNEPSPVVRESLCKALAKRTGISLKAIQQELDILLDDRAHKRSRERQHVLDKLMYDLRNTPGGDAETIIQQAQVQLYELSKKHDSDNLSIESFVRILDEQKTHEENVDVSDVGFKLGKDLKEMEDVLRGEWSEGVFFCIGGKPNVGKTAFLSKFGFEIARNNEDVCVIYHTIDDTSTQLIPRFVTIADGSRLLSINMVRQPNYWSKTVGLDFVEDRRNAGYSVIRNLAKQGRLIVKDLQHGGSIPFIENLICYYQDRYPTRRIVYVLDNFHKLRDFDSKDERVRFKQMSEAMKNIAVRRRCCIISTVEYHKLSPGTKPTNYNIGETQQIEYDANFIAHLYSEVADIPDSFTVCHRQKDWKGEDVMLPRVEMIIGKNKITEIKKSIYFDFWPSASDYRHVDQQTVLMDSKKMRDERSSNSHSDEDKKFPGMIQ